VERLFRLEIEGVGFGVKIAAPDEEFSSASGRESETGQAIHGGQRENALFGDRLTPLILA
jgi:hypothetical protein